MRVFVWLLTVACVAGTALAVSATGARVLAVVEDSASKSAYLAGLEMSGYNVEVKSAAELDDVRLFSYGERRYDHVVMAAPRVKMFPETLTAQDLVSFLEEGGNMLVALSPRLSESWRDWAREFGLEFGERGTQLVDHLRYDAALDAGDHTAVRVGGAPGPLDAGGVVSNVGVFREETSQSADPLVFRGVAHWLGANPLAFPLLLPPASAYQSEVPDLHAARPRKLEPLHAMPHVLTGADAHASETRASLASAVQLRANSARIVFLGSDELLDDALYGDATRPQQRRFVDDVSAWAFQSRGVLEVVRASHRRVRADEADVRPPYEESDGETSMYRIKDTVEYELSLRMYANQKWGPAPRDLDLQLSAVMLDPYVTVPLEGVRDGDATTYRGRLRLPDRHGVFTLRVVWRRPGWSYVVREDVVPVRPFNHDEYPRMLSSSWPYVAGALSTMVGFVAFVALWLTMREPDATRKTQ